MYIDPYAIRSEIRIAFWIASVLREVPVYQQVEGHVDVFRRIYTDFYYDNYRVVILETSTR